MNQLDQAILDFNAFARSLKGNSPEQILAKMHMLERHQRRLGYFARYGDRKPVEIIAPRKPPPLRCAHKSGHNRCPASRTLYRKGDDWYCDVHYPADVTFPIGMHGDEFKAHQEKNNAKGK
jgi:hypothetical protein